MNIRKRIDKALEVVLCLISSLLVIDVVWQVLSRYVLKSPSSFTDELACFLLIWTGLLGAAYVAGKQEHLAIDIWLQKCEGRNKTILQMVIYCCTLVFATTVLVIGGSSLVYSRFLLSVTSASLQINLGYVYMVLPLSGVLISYYTIDNAINYLKSN